MIRHCTHDLVLISDLKYRLWCGLVSNCNDISVTLKLLKTVLYLYLVYLLIVSLCHDQSCSLEK